MQVKNKDSVRHVLIVISICLTIFVFNFIYAATYHSTAIHEEISLHDGWNVSVKHTKGLPEVYSEINLETMRFDMMNRHDVITMSRILPEHMPVHPVLNVFTMHSTIDVYIDGEDVYSYGDDQYRNGELVGYGNHYIILDDDYALKKITITMDISENEAFSTITPPKLMSGDFVHRDNMIQNRFQMIVTLFTIVFGALVAVLATIYSFKNSELRRLIGVGAFAVLIGVWFMCNSCILEVFTYDLQLKVFLEFGTLFAAPTFLFYYFDVEVKKVGGLTYLVYKIILIWQTLFMLTSWLLQLANIVHFPALLKICQLNMCMMVVFLMQRYISGMLRGKMRNGPVVHGFLMLSIFVISDIARFNFQKYSDKSYNEHYVSLVHIGVLVFVISMILDFGLSYLEGVYEKAEKYTLEKLAYSDYLTGLSNRRSIEELMVKLDADKSDYTVIGYDLNNLKKVNDTLGHKEGDLYIKEFAGAIESVFGEYGQSARTGGDEFITILPHGKSLDKEKLIESLKKEIITINSKHANWTMSTAYGYCDYDETGVLSIRDAEKIADERMYENKQRMKAARA